jgi:hypothetical protein
LYVHPHDGATGAVLLDGRWTMQEIDPAGQIG